MDYKYLVITISLTIMTNQAYNGFSFSKLAEQATGCSDYIAKSWQQTSLENKVTIGYGVGVLGICSLLWYRSRVLAPAQQQFTPKQIDPLQQQIDILRNRRDRLLCIAWRLVNMREIACQSDKLLSRVQEGLSQQPQQSSVCCAYCKRFPCPGKSSRCQDS